MSFFASIWDKVKESPSVLYPNFVIQADRVLGEELDPAPFEKDQAYFEIRIKEQFLKNGREYWNEFIPLTIVLTDLIYANQRESLPFVVGPALLKEIEQIEGNESIRYKNTRVLGPTPYGGDQIALFAGLFRMKTKDWALQAVSLLETVAKSFDSTKLSDYVNIAKPLTAGIENFLGMGENMQIRIGHRMEFSDPASNKVDHFKPGYWLMLRQNETDINKRKFWVKEGQLFFGENKDNLKPFDSTDYVLYNIQKLEKRNDYTTFDFHKKWKDVHRGIWDDNRQAATTAYHVLISNLRMSPDLIDKQKNQLQAYYLTQLKKEVKAYEEAKDPFASIEATPKSIKIGSEISSGLILDEKETTLLKNRNDFLIEQSHVISKSLDIEEQKIEEALNSDFLNSREVTDISTDEFSKFAAKVADRDLNDR